MSSNDTGFFPENSQTVVVMCGFPRSGKTTYARVHFKNFVRISLDDLVEMTTRTFHIKFGDFYTSIEKHMIRELVAKGVNIVVDRTSLTKKSRRRTKNRIIKAARDAGLEKPILKLVVVQTPVELCIQRNIATEKVPKGIFLGMVKSFQEPTPDEGWDEIIYVINREQDHE